jgi:SpoVK/Ycf46/Vps4 family AAA+-type ATPase
VLLVLEDLDIGAGHRVISPGAFGELLNAMDGPGTVTGVFVAATTNHPELLDPALSQRPGRFDVTFEVPEAPESARRQALRTLAGDLGVIDDDEITELVQATNGWSMAEVAAIGHMAILISTDTNEPLSLLAGLNEINGNSSTPEPDARSIGYV